MFLEKVVFLKKIVKKNILKLVCFETIKRNKCFLLLERSKEKVDKKSWNKNMKIKKWTSWKELYKNNFKSNQKKIEQWENS